MDSLSRQGSGEVHHTLLLSGLQPAQVFMKFLLCGGFHCTPSVRLDEHSASGRVSATNAMISLRGAAPIGNTANVWCSTMSARK
jgi:hypothetical protein